MFRNLKAKLVRYSQKHRKKIIVLFLIFWLIIFIINTILKMQPEQLPAPSTTYTPHVSVLDSEKAVPEKLQQPIENIIDKYMNYCNNKEYEKAYETISKECREKNYPTLEAFKKYVDHVFEGKKKIYNIQSYSIVDNKYIYQVRILDDILANGSTDGYYYYEEKFVMINDNGELKLSIAEYIGEEQLNKVAEDNNMKVEITNVSRDYETETYTIKVTNKTDKYIVIADNSNMDEILLDLGDQTRRPTNTNMVFFFVLPNSITTQTFTFNKFYDNGIKAKKIMFGNVRVLKEYDWMKGTTQENLDSAVELYAFQVGL
ncbi:MAG: hypothetical protein K6B70_08040 [Clostridia bacterium]|nr:hypothetical protein [Clostridia bacterium]